MLEPRQADLPALFLVLVVLPVVVYILLGRWGDPSKRKERIELVVGERPVQAYREEAMAPPSIIPPSFVPPSAIPPTPPPNAAIKVCARCNAPSTTRCSRCKSVRYCSGKCQIIDWRQGHKDECRPLEDTDSSLELASAEGGGHGRNLSQGSTYAQFMSCPPEQHIQQRARCSVNSQEFNPCAFAATSATVVGPQIPRSERRMSEKKVSRRSTKETSDGKHRAATASTEGSSRKINDNSKEVHTWNKLRGSGFINSEDGYSEMHGINGSPISNGYTDWESTPQPNHGVKSQNRDSLCSTRRGTNANEIGTEHPAPNMNCFRQDNNCSEEVLKKKGFAEMVSSNGGTESRSVPNNECIKQAKSSKPGSKTVREKAQSSKVRKGHASDEPVTGMGNYTTGHGSNGATSIGLMKAIGLKKSSKISNLDTSAMYMDYKKVKVLFPYEEFTKFFNHEVFDLTPRGLLNCGNSCYANAVLQCLTCTKPLVTYLLSGTHSRACCLKNWCLMCELEQHVMMLREAGGPLSPSRILTHIRSINSQMADGSQEDAHEFLRLLVASMQSICLEEVGGESQVHPTLQETTFIQQTFGGRLRSMVTCLRCHHESERYENIMDLTLEINGWVESLENALTQFTTPEDLDGENMYRCARCASYVRAKKQLSIDEAPNILTIVLKRFQEGSYGKINKCITFPEMLDMIPFMTRTNDMPPLYLLYGVVVHVDTLNASFSGHYVSYVKDLQGNWFRIDDSVVQSVPTSQVMSEGAYILFYMRSSPRPPRAYMKKATKPSSRPRTRNSSDVMPQTIHRANNRYTPSMETYAEPNLIQFTDPTASDWSLFTSSDEASFTSDSTRDSFSTADYSDTCHIDPFSSVYTSAHDHPPSQRTISCRMFSGSKPVTRFVSEEKGFVQIGGNSGQVSSEAFLSDSGYQYHHQNFVNYQSDDFLRTFSNCHL